MRQERELQILLVIILLILKIKKIISNMYGEEKYALSKTPGLT